MKKINWHIVFLGALVLLVGFIVYRLANWGTIIDLDYDRDNPNHDYDIEVQDLFFPLLTEDEEREDDGVTTIVAFGNSPFADDKNESNNLARLIEDMKKDTVVYNCAVADSYLVAEAKTFDINEAPMDAFNFFWLTALATLDYEEPYEAFFELMGEDAPEDCVYAYETIKNLDFNKVDVITVMYDATDYYKGMVADNPEIPEGVQHINSFTGNLEAGLFLLQYHFPHIRIIVMSPTYAYAVDENGDYVSSYIYRYAEESLATYAILLANSAYYYGVTFVDNIYGTVNEDDADKYLKDHMHLNLRGRKRVAERFIYALEYFD